MGEGHDNTQPDTDMVDQSQEDTTTTEPATPQAEATESQEDHQPNPHNAEAAKYRIQRNEARAATEAAEARAAAMEQELANMRTLLAKAAGINTDEETQEVAPEDALNTMRQQVEERDQRIAELIAKDTARTIADDVRAAARNAGLDPDLTVTLLKGADQLNELDPTGDDYSSQVESVVGRAAETWPQARTQVVPKSSGQSPNPTTNSTGLGAQITRDDLDRMTPQEIYDAQKAGKLNHLL